MSFQNNTLHPAFEAMDNLLGHFIQEIDTHQQFLRTGIKPYVNLESVYNGIVNRNELFEIQDSFVNYQQFRQAPFVLSQESFSSFITGVWEKIKEFFKKIFGFMFRSKENSIDSKIAKVKESRIKVEEFTKSIHHASNKKVTKNDAPRLVHYFSGIKGNVDVATLIYESHYLLYIVDVLIMVVKELVKDLNTVSNLVKKDGQGLKAEDFDGLELPDLASTSLISERLASSAVTVNDAVKHSYGSLPDAGNERKDISDSVIVDSVRRVMIKHNVYAQFEIYDKEHAEAGLNQKWLKLPYALKVGSFIPDGQEHFPDLDLNLVELETVSKSLAEASLESEKKMRTYATEVKHLESGFTSIEKQIDTLLKTDPENKNLRTFMQLIRGFLRLLHGTFNVQTSSSGYLVELLKALGSINTKNIESKEAS